MHFLLKARGRQGKGETMRIWAILICGFAGLGVVFVAIPIIIRLAARYNLLNRSQDLHHTHTVPVPRFGGLALALGFSVVTLLSPLFLGPGEFALQELAVAGTSMAMFLVGFCDDLRPLGAKWKLGLQVLIATIVYGLGLGVQTVAVPFTSHVIELYSVGYIFTVVWLVGMTNIINLIDGVDGLAGGISLMLMVLLAMVVNGHPSMALLTAGMVGALLGFLWFNFPPARIYLGDGGAYFLGFQIGLLSLMSSNKGNIIVALIAPLFVLALPIVDTSLAILRRGLRGLPIFRADKKHLHHRLMNEGLTRRQVVLLFYGLTLLFLGLGWIAFVSRGKLVPILVGVSAVILLICAGRLKFSREWFAVGRVVGNSLAMRQEVQYGLTLMRWLEQEGERTDSMESLWRDVTFVAGKMGFASVRLKLRDEERVWNSPRSNSCISSLHKEKTAGQWGTLECSGLVCTRTEEGIGLPPCGKAMCPCIEDRKLFEILSELLFEGWVKASKNFSGRAEGTLTFRTRPQILQPRRGPDLWPLRQTKEADQVR